MEMWYMHSRMSDNLSFVFADKEFDVEIIILS